MTGVQLTSYAGDTPPSGFPSASRNGNGDITFTFAASYLDEYGVSGAYIPSNPVGMVLGATAGMVSAVRTGSTLRVRAWDAAGTALSNPNISLTVG
jgi:hypothetical protein